ncbi:YTH domain-containing protein 1-like [Chenopodium quinoa]|uniref:YTH domain-containing protein 1-like n=1 Tax=Chenopodium quinoa TaxID=63459 RepID=UPI000B780B49|nr:YTH domain-containing protein 1-like [Chenopodium quinoa]
MASTDSTTTSGRVFAPPIWRSNQSKSQEENVASFRVYVTDMTKKMNSHLEFLEKGISRVEKGKKEKDESEEVEEDTSEEEDTEEDEETDENAESDLNSDSETRSEEKNVVESDASFESESYDYDDDDDDSDAKSDSGNYHEANEETSKDSSMFAMKIPD